MDHVTETAGALSPLTRRRLILHDSLAFLTLLTITLALFAITLLLFRSFTAHRASLARQWSERGRAALAAAQPQQAIYAFRAALSYGTNDPQEKEDQRLLAQALAAGGRTEEAFNYFMELWEQHPGDGALNLNLARIAATRRDTQQAVNFYRASIYGTWEGDGIERRREVRLELARYLIAQHQPGAARAELLIAAGNVPGTLESNLTLAHLLEEAEAPADAMALYRKALGQAPHNVPALEGAARSAYAEGDLATAYQFLDRAIKFRPSGAPLDPTLLRLTEQPQAAQ